MEKLDKAERNERTIPTMLLPKEAAERYFWKEQLWNEYMDIAEFPRANKI